MASLLALERGGTNVLLDCIKITEPVNIDFAKTSRDQRRQCSQEHRLIARLEHGVFLFWKIRNLWKMASLLFGPGFHRHAPFDIANASKLCCTVKTEYSPFKLFLIQILFHVREREKNWVHFLCSLVLWSILNIKEEYNFKDWLRTNVVTLLQCWVPSKFQHLWWCMELSIQQI